MKSMASFQLKKMLVILIETFLQSVSGLTKNEEIVFQEKKVSMPNLRKKYALCTSLN